MTEVFLKWRSYSRLPYEHELGERELKRVFNAEPTTFSEGLGVSVARATSSQLRRLTYFEEAVLSSRRERVVPLQTLLEQSQDPRKSAMRRQRTRYSAHGLHDYRGKFNPQVARALANIFGLRSGDRVLDPFCGSGTSLLEAAHMGLDAAGIDLNPLGVVIANAKLAALKADPRMLNQAWLDVKCQLESDVRGWDFSIAWGQTMAARFAGAGWSQTLPHLEYLSGWFSTGVLAQLSLLKRRIEVCGEPARSILLVILSDLLREASLQDPQDLRIRRRRNAAPNVPLISRFLSTADDRLARVRRAREILGSPSGRQIALLGDSRTESGPWRRYDAIITSPPYVTALPYIDTQRLSLCFLDLLSPRDLAAYEGSLVGSREFVGQNEKEWGGRLTDRLDQEDLPADALKLVAGMRDAVAYDKDGFRRRRMPRLVLRYFVGMRDVLSRVGTVTRPGGRAALIVGRNRTILGGQEFIIDTPRLVAEIASHVGWDLQEVVTLDAYQRFDIHSRNSIRVEDLVLLARP